MTNLESFKHPTPFKDFTPTNPTNLFGMEYRINSFIKNVSKDDEISILTDNDADGFASAAMLFTYLKKQSYSNVYFQFSEGKSHGLSTVIDQIVSKRPSFLFIPDSSTNDVKDQHVLVDAGISYLILDHHDISPTTPVKEEFLPIINNQTPENKYVNKEFTGVGMVYEFCKALDDQLKTNVADTLLYFFALGQIGDASDISNPEIRSLMLKGFQQIKDHNLFSKSIEADISAHSLSFSIIPLLNAVSRVGTIEDKRKLLQAMTEQVSVTKKEYAIRKRIRSTTDNKIHLRPVKSDFYSYELRELQKIKRRQNKSVEKSVSSLKEVLEQEDFVIAIDHLSELDPGQTGLIATKLSRKYQKPALVLCPTDNNCLSGSGRGFEAIMPDFKKYLTDKQLFSVCAGHPNAFGIVIKEKNIQSLLVNDTKTKTSETTYDVDAIYNNETPSQNDILSFDHNRSLFGGKVSEPTLGFKNLEVKKYTAKIRGNVLSFYVNGINFVLFKAGSDLLRNITQSSETNLCFDIYGSPDVNKYSHIGKPQIIIEDIVQKAKPKPQTIDLNAFVF